MVETLINLARKHRFYTISLDIEGPICCESSKLQELIVVCMFSLTIPQIVVQLLRVNDLDVTAPSFQTFPPSVFASVCPIFNIAYVYVKVPTIDMSNGNYGDAEFIELRQKSITLWNVQVTSVGINNFLRVGQHRISSIN
jgi:hypothetical protein